jgi:hypothetical protein
MLVDERITHKNRKTNQSLHLKIGTETRRRFKKNFRNIFHSTDEKVREIPLCFTGA